MANGRLAAGTSLTLLLLTTAGMALHAAPSPPAPGPSQQPALDLFEREVRPVLLAECVSCHGPKLQQGGLRLDTREGALKGGVRGPSLVPGRPERSLILRAARHDGLKMPPSKKLPERSLAALEAWVRAGAPWPAAASAPAKPSAPHWAFRPVRRPPLPKVRAEAWVRTPVDRFILARLEAAGLSPSPEADRRTLLRRLYYDLIGLPPTPEETEAFLNDRAPHAYEKVVDRLLASPRYGERWGRHWLDLARYADTKDGVLMFGDSRLRPYAYTFRDYVVRALNADTPYNRFLQEQLAADQLPLNGEDWRLAAMGFLTLGRQFDNNVHDVIDDQIDTVSRGMLGLTVSCARCHDHKYDPIPTADYYSLYGVFAGSEAPLDLPLISQEKHEGAAEFEKAYLPKKQEFEQHLEQQFTLLRETARERVADYLVHAATTEPDPLETAIFFLSLSPEDLRPQIVARWRRLLAARATPEDPVFGPWRELMESAGRADACAAVLERWGRRPRGTAQGQVNPLVLEALQAKPLPDRAAVARAYGELLRRLYDESRAPSPAAQTPERKQLLDLVLAPESPAYFIRSHTYYYMSRGEKDRYGGLRNELDVIAVKHAGAPPRAMVLNDATEPYEPRIFVRGNPSEPGERVPRRFLKVLAGEARQPFPTGSGRLDLARAITDPANPLTARVLVNRVWMHHFGEPLVSTPSDFGLRSTPPTHPELLDWLAASFVAPAPDAGRKTQDAGLNWSLKALHRLLVTSAAYRQSSQVTASGNPQSAIRNPQSKDPENRLLWHAHRRRLDFEQMRDTLLHLSGRLDTAMGGRPSPDAAAPANRRRTVYCLVDRQSLPEVFRAFDFPQPDQSVERRPHTTVAQQALFGLNSPFILEQARAVVARPEVQQAGGAPEARVEALYRLLFARKPRPEETTAALAFVKAAPANTGLDPWAQYAQVLLLTNELMFLD